MKWPNQVVRIPMEFTFAIQSGSKINAIQLDLVLIYFDWVYLGFWVGSCQSQLRML